jgi:hypothetical protein
MDRRPSRRERDRPAGVAAPQRAAAFVWSVERRGDQERGKRCRVAVMSRFRSAGDL